MRVESIQAGAEKIGDAPFIDEKGELRLADGQLAAVLNFAVLHGVAVRKNALLRLDPLDNVNPLFGNEISKAHSGPLFRRAIAGTAAFEAMLRCAMKRVNGSHKNAIAGILLAAKGIKQFTFS